MTLQSAKLISYIAEVRELNFQFWVPLCLISPQNVTEILPTLEPKVEIMWGRYCTSSTHVHTEQILANTAKKLKTSKGVVCCKRNTTATPRDVSTF